MTVTLTLEQLNRRFNIALVGATMFCIAAVVGWYDNRQKISHLNTREDSEGYVAHIDSLLQTVIIKVDSLAQTEKAQRWQGPPLR